MLLKNAVDNDNNYVKDRRTKDNDGNYYGVDKIIIESLVKVEIFLYI